jgi:hypothetical protein
MSALSIIQRRAHGFIAAVTPSFLHLLPDLPCDYDVRPCVAHLSPVCCSLLQAREALLRRSFSQWSRVRSSVASQRLCVAFACWAFHKLKPRLPFSSPLSMGDILQPSCRSSVLTASASMFFSLRPKAPSMCLKWTRGIFCFIRLCILQHICERVLGWYVLLSTRTLTGHWRMIASQLSLCRTLGRWRLQQKLRRYFKNWRMLCSQESKVRMHRCYYDSFSWKNRLRLCLTHWHVYARKIFAAKKLLSHFARLFVLRRALFAWRQLVHVQSFASCRFHLNEMKFKRLFFDGLQRWRYLSIYSKQLAEGMRTSVLLASTARLLRTSFKNMCRNLKLSHENIKFINGSRAAAQHFLRKAFKRWAIIYKDNRLQAFQQVAT